jgi:aryl carrier-like protein
MVMCMVCANRYVVKDSVQEFFEGKGARVEHMYIGEGQINVIAIGIESLCFTELYDYLKARNIDLKVVQLYRVDAVCGKLLVDVWIYFR